MKPSILTKLLIVLFMSLTSIRCGTELIILAIVAFSATWDVEGDPDHTIEFRQDFENRMVPMGIFTGREFHQSNPDLDQNLLAGSFNGKDIEFIIQRRNIGQEIKYQGIMETTGPDDNSTAVKMILDSSIGTLVLLPQ